VSVIIPCYNYGRYLPEAVASVAAQTLGDLEIIIVDDGSTDETAEVIAGLVDPRVRIRRTSNRGISAARNAGLDMARGEFIAFLDADDYWEPTKLERQVAIMDAEPEVTLVFTDFRRFSADGEVQEHQFSFVPELGQLPVRASAAGGGLVIIGDAFTALAPLPQLPAWIQTDLFRTAAVRDLRFAEELRLGEDLHYIMRCYLRGRAAFIGEALVHVRRHDSNSYRGPEEMLVPVIDALELLRGEMLGRDHRRVLSERIGNAWIARGYHEFWEGHPMSGAAAYLRAALKPGRRANAIAHAAAAPAAPIFRFIRRRPQSSRPDER
jgi:glycosyltransferase involved in cell wall biosynthesis